MAEAKLKRGSAAAERPAELIFFAGFGWPVPTAFAGALAAFRFEQGDVLYRDRRGYAALDGTLPKGLSAIQVLLPKRSARATAPGEFDGGRRRSNWESEVTVELIDLTRGESETRVLTQGRLATALFSGNDQWLDPNHVAPDLPKSGRELQQNLVQTEARFDALQNATSGCRFIFVVDLVSDGSRAKASDIEDALGASGAIERIDLSAKESGVEKGDAYHPALIVRCLVLENRTMAAVLPTLRARLYGGGVAASESADDGQRPSAGKPADRFSIGRHGILQALGVRQNADSASFE